VIERLFGRHPDPVPIAADHRPVRMQRASESVPEPSPPSRQGLVQRVKSALTPRPEPPPPQPALFACDDGHRAQVIPDEEYSKRFQDIPTRNYRESVARNEREFAEKRGYPPSRSSLIR
jgi:hypothetical protein